MAAIPHREIRDPQALRAIAHPVRIRLLEELLIAGSATATELAERVGESPANCSWHLRQLARYGYIEEAGGGAGRQRPWQIVLRTETWGGDDSSPAAAAGDAATELLLDRERQVLRDWFTSRHNEPASWRQAAFVAFSRLWLSADELREINAELQAIAARYLDRFTEPAKRPPGARLVRIVTWAVPTATAPQASLTAPEATLVRDHKSTTPGRN